MTEKERNQTEREAVSEIIRAADGAVIVELGAYHGEELEWVRKIGFGRYVMVEADPRHAEWIRGHRNLDGVDFIEAAIADHDGQALMYLADNDILRQKCSSSIRKPKEHLRHFPWCTFNQKTMVSCVTLDALCSSFGLEKIDLIWSDLQGAERDMIAGGAETLKQARYLLMESDSCEMYEGQAMRDELTAMLPGWELAGEFDYNILLKNTCA